MEHVFETPLVRYIVHEHSIWEVVYKENIPKITRELAEVIVAERLIIQRKKPCRLLLHGDREIPIAADAKHYFSSPAGNRGIAAAAILINNWTLRTAVRFLLKIQTPQFPVAIFQDVDQAKEWLLRQELKTEKTVADMLENELQYLDLLFECSPCMRMLIGEDQIIKRVNEIVCHRLGYTQEQLIGKPISTVTHNWLQLVDCNDMVVPLHMMKLFLGSEKKGIGSMLLTAWNEFEFSPPVDLLHIKPVRKRRKRYVQMSNGRTA